MNEFSITNIMSIIGQDLDPEINCFVDAGNCGAFAVHHLKTRGVSPFYICLGMGGMGNSLPMAIGCTMTNKKRSYVFIGDGSFLISGLELHTAVQNELPISVFIFNNNSHGMCTTREEIFLSKSTGINDFKPTHFGRGISGLFPQIYARDVYGLEELQREISHIKLKDGIQVLSLNVRNELPPFRTFKKE